MYYETLDLQGSTALFGEGGRFEGVTGAWAGLASEIAFYVTYKNYNYPASVKKKGYLFNLKLFTLNLVGCCERSSLLCYSKSYFTVRQIVNEYKK
jgi:hypothetical protein